MRRAAPLQEIADGAEDRVALAQAALDDERNRALERAAHAFAARDLADARVPEIVVDDDERAREVRRVCAAQVEQHAVAPRDRNDAHTRVLPAKPLTGCRVAQMKTALAALEPEPQALRAQNSSSFRTASTTRSTDGMYASSICHYGYGTS